eukprot:CAMPEP_0179054230 /NCGR_PEP_ID=MMETSP0796-20121207/22679_1 /TAXON_ID=73915 /ORGANISM="Pyrodinium bahamense, Strain pbaha01" /LENGTH=78 /DNA_ID=CAMNT_0020750847 /DNA_START=463 /DNA_END=699 /DNA_ORIENTATION=+
MMPAGHVQTVGDIIWDAVASSASTASVSVSSAVVCVRGVSSPSGLDTTASLPTSWKRGGCMKYEIHAGESVSFGRGAE